MNPTRKVIVRDWRSGRILSDTPRHSALYPEARHTGRHDPVVMLARLACHLAPEGRSEILGMALAMEVL